MALVDGNLFSGGLEPKQGSGKIFPFEECAFVRENDLSI